MSASMLAGCINNYDECPVSPADDTEVSLSIRMIVPSAMPYTRAAGHEDEPGTEDEGMINIEGSDPDFHVVVFDDESGWRMFEFDAASIVEAKKEEVSGSDNLVSYTLTTGNINNKWAGLKSGMKIRVMVLANWKSFDAGSTYDFSNTCIGSSTVAENLFLNGTDYNFTMPNTATTAWTPSYANRRLIPMCGISAPIDVILDEQARTTEISGVDISMVRSIAKVEIVDYTEKHPIANVTLSHRVNTGRFIPNLIANSGWNQGNAQMSLPSIPSGFSMTAGDQKFSSSNPAGSEAKVWSFYLPEIDFTSSPAKDNRPAVQITYNNGKYAFQLDNNVKKASKGNPASGDGTLDYVLRNHIYRYNITESGSELQVALDVLPWDMEWEDEWHYDLPTVKQPDDFDENNPQYPYYLTWTLKMEDHDNQGVMIDNGYIDKEGDLQLIMKPSIDEYAEAKFTLSAPLKATWYAVLVPLQGELDAFEFYNDGEKTWDHGVIDGSEGIIRIRNTREIVSNERNEARLEIVVEYPDKTHRQAFVVKPNPNGNNYTIVQQKTAID